MDVLYSNASVPYNHGCSKKGYRPVSYSHLAKVIENSQRDINIAFMNELSIIFNKMGIDTKDVLEAAETKWNFLKFYPGLVGGHCIDVYKRQLWNIRTQR